MPTNSTEHTGKQILMALRSRAALLAAAGFVALALAAIMLISTHKAPEGDSVRRQRASAVAAMEPLVPWSASGSVNGKGKTVPLREGPYSLKTKAAELATGKGFITLLGNGLSSDRFYISDYPNNDSFQGGDWHPENVVFDADGVRLDVTRTGDPKKPFALAEAQLTGVYGYGRYETIMRPANGSGLVSAFFTFTGPPFGDPHDEIDIEFVGTTPDVVEFNYFHNGRKGHYARIKLPFDASEEDHLYAFDWTPEGIRWYVDGKLYYRTPEGDPNIPTKPGRIYMSNWTGIPALRQWHGQPDFGDRGSAYYSCISYTPLDQNTRRCADIFQPGTQFPAPYKD